MLDVAPITIGGWIFSLKNIFNLNLKKWVEWFAPFNPCNLSIIKRFAFRILSCSQQEPEHFRLEVRCMLKRGNHQPNGDL
jgi:hypothetical protein